MAAVATPVPPWIPEDDLLLKNAVEAGASLEALAKGAVRFSRKFTVRELQERWHSLLYDPLVSAEASAGMAELELSTSNITQKFNRSGNSRESAAVPAKRKVESVRRLYYAMRKKTCNRPSNSSSLSFLDSAFVNDSSGHESAFEELAVPHSDGLLGDCIQKQLGFQDTGLNILHDRPKDIISKGIVRNEFPGKVPTLSVKEMIGHGSFEQTSEHEDSSHIPQDNLVQLGSGSGAERMGPFHSLSAGMEYSSPQPLIPLWKTVEDISAPMMPIDMSNENEGQMVEEASIFPDNMMERDSLCSSGHDVYLGTVLHSRHMNVELHSLDAISESNFADLSDSLLNFTNEGGPAGMDAHGKETIDKSFHDNLNSLLLSSPNNVHEDDVPNAKGPPALVSKTCPAASGFACLAELEALADHQTHAGHIDQHSISPSEDYVPLPTAAPNLHPPELLGGEMRCTLNTEDPEIPCNDDVLLVQASASSLIEASCKEARFLTSSFPNQKDGKQEQSVMKKEDNPAHIFVSSLMIGSGTVLQPSQDQPHVIGGLKCETHGDKGLFVVSRQASDTIADPNQWRLTHGSSCFATKERVKEDPLNECNFKDVPLQTKTSSTTNNILESATNPSAIGEEECESDDDVPCVSDIEAMILAMDLCPDDSDSCLSWEVARYQNENSKRAIIRLEQCARSCMQRAIAFQGALAIMYGQHLKHYIRKTEVILGRATSDFEVDIDLGRHGHANKISRRQALIKMEENGSFSLKNLGKSSVFVNGKEIATGQVMALPSSSLIEIREVVFVFEMNEKSVRRYLAERAKNKQEQNTNFEWSEEDAS